MADAMKPEPPKKVELKGYVDERLRDLAIAYADEQDIPLSECVAYLVAKALRRPDLAVVPRKRLGRPRKDAQKPPEQKS